MHTKYITVLHEAPINVPQSGGSTFDKWEWIDACFSTPRGSNCTSTFACKGGGGPITARCNVTGLWEYLSGECAVPPAICSSAPSSVPTSGGASFLSEVWKTQCGQKKEGETCTVINAACSTNGNITAKCTKVNQISAAWTDIQGACNAPASCGATPMPLSGLGWTTNGAPLDAAAWSSGCSTTTQGHSCSVQACGLGFAGTLSAVCQADKSWGQLSGTCTADSFCTGAPTGVPASGGATFSASKWLFSCGLTKKGNSCSSNGVCSGGSGTITARCEASGSWTYQTGSCSPVVIPPSPSPNCAGAPTNVPESGGSSFDEWEFIDACFFTLQGSTCTSANACKPSGTPVTARCDASGSWVLISGECRP